MGKLHTHQNFNSMAILYVRATYTEEENLKKFFLGLFGWGNFGVEVRQIQLYA